MLTKWAKRVLRFQTNDHLLPGVTTNGKTLFEIKGTLGTIKYGGITAGGLDFNVIKIPKENFVERGTNYTHGIAFGTGITSPTEDDYTIESIITSNLSLTSTPVKQHIFDSNKGKVTVYYDITVANSESEDVIISEICFIGNITCSDNLGDNINAYVGNNFSVLFDRTVLDNPVTIPANESAVIRYSVEYNSEEQE